jgi:hypothetical protein
LITISPALAAPTVTTNAATMAARDFIFGHLSGQWNSSWALHYKQDGNH